MSEVEEREFRIGDKTVTAPMFTLRLSKRAYPLCLKLAKAQMIERWAAGAGVVDATDSEMDDLISLALLSAQAKDPDLTREAFEDGFMSPNELIETFLLARYQTGMWKPTVPGAEPPAGEKKATPKRPKSTSAQSSQG